MRERDPVGRQGGFIAEAEVMLRVLLSGARRRAAPVLVAETRLARLAPLLEATPAETPVYVASQAVVDAIAGSTSIAASLRTA